MLEGVQAEVNHLLVGEVVGGLGERVEALGETLGLVEAAEAVGLVEGLRKLGFAVEVVIVVLVVLGVVLIGEGAELGAVDLAVFGYEREELGGGVVGSLSKRTRRARRGGRERTRRRRG